VAVLGVGQVGAPALPPHPASVSICDSGELRLPLSSIPDAPGRGGARSVP
jgi:hypothetical protein